MKTFDLNQIDNPDTTSIDWARTAARIIFKDTPTELDEVNGVFPPYGLDDEVYNFYLNTTSKKINAVVYYVPWEAVATFIESDPKWATRISQFGYSSEFREATDLAASIRKSYSNSMINNYPTVVQMEILLGNNVLSSTQLIVGF